MAFQLVDYGGGYTPLQWACMNGRSEQTIRLLLDHGADPNRYTHGMSPLLWAMLGNSDDHKDGIIHALLSRRADANAHAPNGDTPLMLAVVDDNAKIVRLLLSYHANPNVKNAFGLTPLSIQKRSYSPSFQEEELARRQIIQMLKQAGAKE